MTSIRDKLADIYARKATGRYGLSAVNQLQHALQSAALAEAACEDAKFIAAALLHDVGHMIHELGEVSAEDGIDDAHEELAGQWLAQHFGPDVSEPVRLHVPAKRYLCAVDPTYFAKLSEDSVRSLALQGGPMSAAEVAEFEKLPQFEAAVRLRLIDDQAKSPTAVTPPFTHFVRYIDQALMA